MDLTGDGLFTISDIWALFGLLWAWLVLLFFLPANLILMAMYKFAPGLVVFLELSPTYEYTMGWGTGITSGLAWLMVYAAIYLVLEYREMRQREAEQARQEKEWRQRYDESVSTDSRSASFRDREFVGNPLQVRENL